MVRRDEEEKWEQSSSCGAQREKMKWGKKRLTMLMIREDEM
jgi:hypothetical protein